MKQTIQRTLAFILSSIVLIVGFLVIPAGNAYAFRLYEGRPCEGSYVGGGSAEIEGQWKVVTQAGTLRNVPLCIDTQNITPSTRYKNVSLGGRCFIKERDGDIFGRATPSRPEWPNSGGPNNRDREALDIGDDNYAGDGNMPKKFRCETP